MPNSARPGGALSKARLLRSAQASESRIARSISFARRRQLQAFVELHGDVGAEQALDLDRALGRQLDHGAVEMGAEGDALVLDLAQLRQRHDLEAAGIGQDRRAASS